MTTSEILTLIFTVVFAENALFTHMYGVDGLERITEEPRTAGLCGALLMLVAAISEALIYVIKTVLSMCGLPDPGYAVIAIVPIVTIAVAAGLIYSAKKLMFSLYEEIKPYEKLIAINTASVGVIFAVSGEELSLTDSVVRAALSMAGVMLMYVIFAFVRESIPESKQPKAIRGLPTLLLTAGLIAMVFCGFSDMRI